MQPTSIDLTGRNLLLMGASSPVAAAVALAFATAGADVAVTTSTSDAEEAFELRRLTRRIGELGRRGIAESVDMSLGANVQIAVRQIAKQLGRIDVLVAAPDLRLSRPAERMSDADWAKVLNANLSAVFYACRGAAREMLSAPPIPNPSPIKGEGDQRASEGAPRGRIIVLLPTRVDVEPAGLAAYAAARAGVEALVLALAQEWEERGITVNALALPSLDNASIGPAVAATALWLASSEGDTVTGRIIAVESDDDQQHEAGNEQRGGQ